MTQDQAEAIQAQAGKLLGQVSGFVGTHAVAMGLVHGLFEAVAKHADGCDPETLAAETGLDPFYVGVWCRTAFGAEVLEVVAGEERYTLAPHIETLLLNDEFPGWIGGLFQVITQPELSQQFSERLPTGERIWWDQVSPQFIAGVAGTSRPFYTRLLGTGLAQVPGLRERLEEGASVLDLACGVCSGMARMAQQFPNSTFVGLDGDAHSLEVAAENLRAAGVSDRCSTVQSTLEEFDESDQYDLVLINVSMHECRDIERVTANVHRALKSGGHFVISDFPFPASHDGMRTVPARVMSGIQFFEALIGDQLLPTQAYVDLLNAQGFRDVDWFDLAPVHAVTYGVK